jgi:hypothetical protein
MSANLLRAIKPPNTETIEAYRAAVRAWRVSGRSLKQHSSRTESHIPRSATIAVKKLRPDLSESQAQALAEDAISWAEQTPNECFWDL